MGPAPLTCHVPPAQVTACSPATPCTHGHFCDKHFGLCLPTRPAGQYCRRDTHCTHGLLCMFGKCQQPVPDGQEGEQGSGMESGRGDTRDTPLSLNPGGHDADGVSADLQHQPRWCQANGCWGHPAPLFPAPAAPSLSPSLGMRWGSPLP